VLPAVDEENPELERLWALSRIDEVMQDIRERGESEDLQTQVARLGVDYSLVTDYTSMVVVRDEQAEALGLGRRNADRVSRERAAQAVREQAPVRQHRIDTAASAGEGQSGGGSGGGGMFGGLSAPGIGSGPVGPLFVMFSAWMARRRRKE
jgi:Ca-activated chloride channel family protein